MGNQVTLPEEPLSPPMINAIQAFTWGDETMISWPELIEVTGGDPLSGKEAVDRQDKAREQKASQDGEKRKRRAFRRSYSSNR